LQISASLNTAILSSPIQRRDVSERGPRERDTAVAVNDVELRPDRVAGDLQSTEVSLSVRPVESSTQPDRTFSRQAAETDDLSLNARKALQTFTDNSPSAQQQLGVELAGINTYA